MGRWWKFSFNNAIESKEVLLKWHPQPGQQSPSVPLLKDMFASEEEKLRCLIFSLRMVGEARKIGCLYTLLGRVHTFPSTKNAPSQRSLERVAINTPVYWL